MNAPGALYFGKKAFAMLLLGGVIHFTGHVCNLDRHGALNEGVECLVDNAHGATPNASLYFVFGYFCRSR